MPYQMLPSLEKPKVTIIEVNTESFNNWKK